MKLKKLMFVPLALAAVATVASCGAKNSGTAPTSSAEKTTSSVAGTSAATNSSAGESSTVASSTGTSQAAVTSSSVAASSSAVKSSSAAASSSSSQTTPSTPNYEENGSSTGSIDTGAGSVQTEGQVDVVAVFGLNESAYVLFNAVTGATAYNIYVDGKLADSDVAYTRAVSATQYRTDILGITAGTHSIKIVPIVTGVESTATATVCSVTAVAYDRSGYAHFNYNEGVGAYNNDGTLKDNAIVLYVDDTNKNTVQLSYNGVTSTGIGSILNSVGQKCGEAGHEDQCKKVSSGKTYYAAANDNNGIIKLLAENNIPLVVRFVGIVSETGLYENGTYDASNAGLIDGLTEYDSNDYGGSEGDNGHMARMKSGKNITIEGVGSDAALDGWGIHYICETAATDLGKNFEVRNLAFMNTPEDAIGMEGQQDGTTISAPVERCWIHHNTFYCPHISSPAESDKSEGDGSCDFKRGMYYTLAYNYFEYCHKTNLIGSSDSSLQYNISMHHNVWYNCGSRIPLLRQANVHFYNNYIYGDSTDSNAELSYVTSLRANCYMYSENNYYEGCKQVTDSKTGGAAKFYGNSYVECFSGIASTVTLATSRDQQVSSDCAYNGTSYANFDTNSSLFYYDSDNKVSDCYLTNSAVARQECIKYAGSYMRTIANKTSLSVLTTDFNKVTPANAVEVPTTGTKSIAITTSKGNSTSDNVEFTNVSGVSSGTAKFKGHGVVFKLDTYATVTVALSSSTSESTSYSGDGYLVAQSGEVMLIGSGTAVLAPGIYTITAWSLDKETTISSLSFTAYDSEALKDQLIAEYNAAYAEIPSNITYTQECYQKIKNAINAYNALGSYKSEVSTDPNVALSAYISLGETYVEGLISAIGTVTKDSGPAITAARTAYNNLIAVSTTATVDNYATLTAAEVAFEEFAITACIEAIDAIGTVTSASGDAITYARNVYDSLESDQKSQVTNYATLTAAEATYKSIQNVINVNTLINECDVTSLTSVKAVIDAYNALTATEQAQVEDPSSYADIEAAYVKLSIDALPATITRSDKDTVEAIRALYEALTADQKAQVTNLATLEAAEATIAALPTEQVTTTSDFSSGWTLTGTTTSTALSGGIYTGNTMTAVSNNTYNDISSITVNFTVTDKGTTNINVYVSTDGTTWTSVGSFSAKTNNTATDGTATVSVSGACYIKVEGTCTKGSAKTTTVSTISITYYN